MVNTLRKLLKVLAIMLAATLLAVLPSLSGVFYWLSKDETRQQLFEKGMELLQEKLQTRVSADSMRLELRSGQMRLYGLQINDRDDSLLVRIDELHAGIDPQALKHRIIRVTSADLHGADARLWRDSLHSNFQFIADALRKKPVKTTKKTPNWVKKWQLQIDVEDVSLQHVHARWDVRHKAPKNQDKPHRGAFDANHVDVTLNLKASVKQPAKDTYQFILKDMTFQEHKSGLKVNQLLAKATLSKEQVDVSQLIARMASTEVSLQPFTIDLKHKRIVNPFSLSANVLLQDIAEPFAPDLGDFTTPLQLTTQVSGPLACLNVDDIHIQTPDKHLELSAKGTLDGLFRKAKDLNLQFSDIDLKATHNMKEQIVMHFAKKMRLKMIRQMKAIGDIRFQGTLDILYKKEIISGKLTTHFGYVNTRFTLDGSTRKMTGYLVTPSLEMGKLMNIPKLGPVNCRIDFDLNISRKTPRPVTALPNGRLPMGKIKAWVYNTQYSSITAPEVCLDLQSDGSTASGYLWMPGQLKDLSVDVSYIQTDEEQTVWFQSTREAQQWLLRESVDLLSDKLQTEVEADSIEMHLLDGEARLYGIRVKDRQNHPLFSMDSLRVSLDAQELLQYSVHVTNLSIYGIDAQLNKNAHEDNFRFLLEAFKKDGERKEATRHHERKRLFQLAMDVQELNLERLHMKWDVTDKPLRQQENPNKGIFNPNHLDLMLNMQAAGHSTEEGLYALEIKNMNLKELESGLQVDSVRTRAVWNMDQLQLSNLYVKLPQSWISMDSLTFAPETMSFSDPVDIKAHVVLQDIAEAFSPAMSHFTTPLDISARVSGDLSNLEVENVQLQTPDARFTLGATGKLKGLREEKDSLNLQFRNIDLQSDNETLMQLVMHFSTKVRLKMIRQMKALGHIHFMGKADILPKQEDISGDLVTEYGAVKTEFTLDGITHHMQGYVETPALELGKFLNVRRLGAIDGHIDFNFNLSAKTSRSASALPNGRLPQGDIKATINNARYGKIRAGKILGTVQSDGSTASGNIQIHRKLSKTTLKFNYIQTDEEQHLKVKPKIRFNLRLKRKKEENDFQRK